MKSPMSPFTWKKRLSDISKKDYQYYTYDPRDHNRRGKIELQVQDTSRYFLPSEAFIVTEGQILTSAGHSYADGDKFRFVNK